MSDDKILYNIKLVVLTPIDEKTGAEIKDAKPIFTDTYEEIKLKPVVSKGNEKILRNDDRILATAKTPNLTYGYEVETKDNRFSLNVVQLVEGGEFKYDEEEPTKIIGYKSPMLSEGNLSKPFKTDIYVEEKVGDDTVGYTKFTLNKCLGTAPDFQFKSGEFYSPSFKIDARENTNAKKPIKEIEFVPELPTQGVEA